MAESHSGNVVAKYPSGKIVQLEGRFFVHFDPAMGDTPAVVRADGPIFLLDPRAVVTVNGSTVYRPRGHRLIPEMIRWLRENPEWDANKG